MDNSPFKGHKHREHIMEITTFKKIAMWKYAACSGKRGRKQTVTPMEMPKKANYERPAWFQKMLDNKEAK